MIIQDRTNCILLCFLTLEYKILRIYKSNYPTITRNKEIFLPRRCVKILRLRRIDL